MHNLWNICRAIFFHFASFLKNTIKSTIKSVGDKSRLNQAYPKQLNPYADNQTIKRYHEPVSEVLQRFAWLRLGTLTN